MDFSNIAGVIILALGLLFLWQGWKYFRLARTSHHWVQVPGVITHVKIRNTHDAESQFNYEAQIIYSYTVGRLEFSCSTLAIGKERVEMTGKDTPRLHERYPLHGQVQVFYDPSNPARAVLEPGKEGNSVLLMAVGFGMVAYGCISFT